TSAEASPSVPAWMFGRSPVSLPLGFSRPWTAVPAPCTCAPAEVKSDFEQSPFSWKCRPCQPGDKPFASMRITTPFGASVSVTAPTVWPVLFFSSAIRVCGAASAAPAIMAARAVAAKKRLDIGRLHDPVANGNALDPSEAAREDRCGPAKSCYALADDGGDRALGGGEAL